MIIKLSVEELQEIARKHLLKIEEMGAGFYDVVTLEYGLGLFRIEFTIDNRIKMVRVLDYALFELEHGDFDYLKRWYDFLEEIR